MLLLPIFTIKIEFLRIGVISDATPFLEPTNQVDSFMMISQDMLCCVFKTQHSSFIINEEIDSGPTHNQHNYLHVKSQKPLIQKSP